MHICTYPTNERCICATSRSGLLARLMIASHVQKTCDISLELPPYISTLQTTSQSTTTCYPHCLKMADPRDTMKPGVGPIINSSPLPTASDTRRQIIANALVEYPRTVRNHDTKFSNIPVRPEDIFDVCVADVIDQYGSEDGSEDSSKYIAKLSLPHKGYPAARMLLSGRVMPTMNLALHGLLERSANGLGASLDTLFPLGENRAEAMEGPHAGYALDKESVSKGLEFAQKVRQMAIAFDLDTEPTPSSGSGE